jgi:hypothetical protein
VRKSTSPGPLAEPDTNRTSSPGPSRIAVDGQKFGDPSSRKAQPPKTESKTAAKTG